VANIKIRKIDKRKDYEKSGFKSTMDEVGLRRNEALSLCQVQKEISSLKAYLSAKK
jgi:hypothetical protein